MKCEFILDNDIYTCKNCGYKLKTSMNPESIIRPCYGNLEPSLVEKITNVASSVTTWVSNGLPISDAEMIQQRENICKSCENYNNGTCKLCGCGLYLKIRMRTSACPISKW